MTERLIFGVDGGGDHQKHAQESKRGTGWCLIRITDTTPAELLEFGQVVGGPTAWLDAIQPRAVAWPDQHDPAYPALRRATALVVENFKLMNPRASIDPLEIVGMMKMWAAINHVPMGLQMPSQRTGITHDDLKRIGMWPGGAGHADTAQAIRHVLAAILAAGHRPTAMLVSPPPED